MPESPVGVGDILNWLFRNNNKKAATMSKYRFINESEYKYLITNDRYRNVFINELKNVQKELQLKLEQKDLNREEKEINEFQLKVINDTIYINEHSREAYQYLNKICDEIDDYYGFSHNFNKYFS